MILIFIVILVVLALLLEKRMLKRSLADLSADYRTDRNVAEPEAEFLLNITLKNNGKHGISYVKVRVNFPQAMELTHKDAEGVSTKGPGGGPSVIRTVWLRPYEQVELSIGVTIGERGRYVLPHPALYGGDFLGITEQVLRLEQYREIVVAPKEILPVTAAALLGSNLGDFPVRRFLYEDPVLTAGFREYTGHEPMKMISWTQSARGLGLMVKTLDYTAEPAVLVLLNVETAADRREQLLEHGFSLTRMMCKSLEAQGIPYDFATNALPVGGIWGNPQVGEGLGSNHFMMVLECLGRASYTAATPCKALVEKTLGRWGTPRGCIFITPENEFLNEGLKFLFMEATDGHYQVVRMKEELR